MLLQDLQPLRIHYTAKVFAADITPPMDLYFRDANATGTITLDKLSGAVVSKLDGNASALSPVGAVSAIDHNEASPAEHAILERTDRNATHVWEEMAPVSVARFAADGVEALDGKIYFVGGANDSGEKNIAERYDPTTNQWETLATMTSARYGVAAAVLNGRLYAIGGIGLPSVEIFDPQTGQWSAGPTLPSVVQYGTAIAVNGKIVLVGGQNAAGQNINQVLELDPATNQWSQKAVMPTTRHGMKLVYHRNKVWAIGGSGEVSHKNTVESYDPVTDVWSTEASLTTARHWLTAWADNGRIYAAGGVDGGTRLSTIEAYDPLRVQWTVVGSLPESKYLADAVSLDGKIYVVSGQNSSIFSNKFHAADLIPHRDLYFREVNATAPGQPAPNQAPVFSESNATFTTAENNATASFVVTATDPDANTTLVYSSSGPDAGKFDPERSDGNSHLHQYARLRGQRLRRRHQRFLPNHHRNRRRSQRHPSHNRQRDRRPRGQPPSTSPPV